MIDVPVQIKDILREGNRPKNYRFLVLKDDGTTDFIIDNNNLVSESVSIDERMCSGDTLKFGLCEGSSLEFQYFGLQNISGKKIQAFIDVIFTWFDTVGTLTKGTSSNPIAKGGTYRIYVTPENASKATRVLRMRGHAGKVQELVSYPDGHKETTFTECLAGDTFSISGQNGATAELQFKNSLYTIPMGFFDVKNCSRQASTGIIKVTAYNKLMSEYLDAKVANEIVDLINAGEDNSSDISIHKILTTLLEDYAIEPLVTSTPKYEATTYTSNARSVQVIWRSKSTPTVDGGYGTFGAPMRGYNVKLQGVSLNGGNYYYAKILKAFGNKIQAAFDSIIEQINNGNYDYYLHSGGIYTNLVDVLNNTVHIENTDWYYLKGMATFSYRTTPYTTIKRYTNINEMIDDITTDIYLYDTVEMFINIPVLYELTHNNSGTKATAATSLSYSETIMPYLVTLSEIEKMRISETEAKPFYDVTLRELQSAAYELNCQFGKLDRVTDLFSGVYLNYSRLYPAEALYPSDTLYPSGAAASGFKSMYSKLWADEGNIHKWRYLIITYKGLNGDSQEEDYTLQRTVNADGTDDYNMSDNWLFKNLVWTPEQVGAYADAMVLKMRDITWFPFEMWCAGLPYLETGDEIEIPLGEETYTSYILQRQLKGIQNLQDTYINGTLDIF